MELSSILGTLITLGTVSGSGPIVETRWGKIQGQSGEVNHQSYDEFLGIPFAQPAIGNLRFSPTLPWNTTWNETYMATEFGPSCPQPPGLATHMSEDCLFLNIWRPHSDRKDSDKLLPVLYFLHGSGFQFGSGNQPNGRILSVLGQIIVVTSNYRLGCLGWAYGHSDEMPGNLGIFDAMTVLHWLHDNIRNFGGDPDQITLSGQSAGAMIASCLPGLSSLPILYRRMFLMSGASTGNIFMESKETSLEKTKILLNKAGCGSIDSKVQSLTKAHIECLKNSDPHRLVEIQSVDEIRRLSSAEFVPFLPVHGTKLVPQPVNELIWNRKGGPKLDIIFGTQLDEASHSFPIGDVSTLEDAYRFLRERLSWVKKDLTEDEMETFFEKYFKDSQMWTEHQLREKVVEFITDFSFYSSSLILSEIYSRRDNVRAYVNHYVFDKLGSERRPFGPQHGDDVPAFFGDPFQYPEDYSDKDRRFSFTAMELLSNFVKGKEFEDWQKIQLNPQAIEKNQSFKKLTLRPSIITDTKQQICLDWAKLLDFGIPSHL